MELQSIYFVAEIVAAVAVIISLVYVAKQLRVNTNALQASAAWDSEVIFGNANVDTARHPQFALLATKASSADAKVSDFDEAEMAQLYFAVRATLQLTQAQWWLWKSGSLPDELWAYRSQWARNFVESPVINNIWQADLTEHIFSEEFVAEINATLRHGELSFSPHVE